MPAPPETPRRRSDPAGRDEVPQEIPAKTERLVDERISELRAEIDALRRENAELRLAETERRRDEETLRKEKERVGAILSALPGSPLMMEGVENNPRTTRSCRAGSSRTWRPGRYASEVQTLEIFFGKHGEQQSVIVARFALLFAGRDDGRIQHVRERSA